MYFTVITRSSLTLLLFLIRRVIVSRLYSTRNYPCSALFITCFKQVEAKMKADLQMHVSRPKSLRLFPNKKDGKGIWYNPNFILKSFLARFKSLPLEKKTKPRLNSQTNSLFTHCSKRGEHSCGHLFHSKLP